MLDCLFRTQTGPLVLLIILIYWVYVVQLERYTNASTISEVSSNNTW